MKLSVVGTGYVGLVAGTCFAEFGNTVYCVDIDEKKIEGLKQGILPIYEPGLAEMVLHNHAKGRLLFTTDLKEAVENSDIIFIAVGTPDGGDGRPDLRGVFKVAEDIGKHANGYKIIVDKSTVPVGTARKVKEAVGKQNGHPFDVVSNPEFLREGRAIEDFMKPERVVIGAESDKAGDTMKELYSPFVLENGNPVLVMTIPSAELTKYACNAFLAMKISFVNEIANLCDQLEADYQDVKLGLGSDSRIGKKFLNAGIGYGGSCFPKDVRALVQIAGDSGIDVPLIKEVENVNYRQKLRLVEIIEQHYKKKGESISGKKFAVWGLAFKAGTDDMREAPSINIINQLVDQGAEVLATDPVAHETSKVHFGDKINYGEMYDILHDADALLVLTEWPVYLEPDFERVRKSLKEPLVFDGRNMYRSGQLEELGFTHYGIGISSGRSKI